MWHFKSKGASSRPLSQERTHRCQGTATIVLALERTKVVLFAQRILSVQRMDGPPCAWWPRYKNSFPVCLQGSPFTFQHSRATPRKHMRHNQEVRNGCWYASKCSSAGSLNELSKSNHLKEKKHAMQNCHVPKCIPAYNVCSYSLPHPSKRFMVTVSASQHRK